MSTRLKCACFITLKYPFLNKLSPLSLRKTGSRSVRCALSSLLSDFCCVVSFTCRDSLQGISDSNALELMQSKAIHENSLIQRNSMKPQVRYVLFCRLGLMNVLSVLVAMLRHATLWHAIVQGGRRTTKQYLAGSVPPTGPTSFFVKLTSICKRQCGAFRVFSATLLILALPLFKPLLETAWAYTKCNCVPF